MRTAGSQHIKDIIHKWYKTTNRCLHLYFKTRIYDILYISTKVCKHRLAPSCNTYATRYFCEFAIANCHKSKAQTQDRLDAILTQDCHWLPEHSYFAFLLREVFLKLLFLSLFVCYCSLQWLRVYQILWHGVSFCQTERKVLRCAVCRCTERGWRVTGFIRKLSLALSNR